MLGLRKNDDALFGGSNQLQPYMKTLLDVERALHFHDRKIHRGQCTNKHYQRWNGTSSNFHQTSHPLHREIGNQ